jgi:hypothetical protein
MCNPLCRVIFKGDIVASSWPSKLFMMFMIIIALIVIPTQVSRTKTYSKKRRYDV